MSAVKTPMPNFRSGRVDFIRREIREQSAQMLTMVPGIFTTALDRGPDPRSQVTWEAVAHRANELRCLCAELEGLEARP